MRTRPRASRIARALRRSRTRGRSARAVARRSRDKLDEPEDPSDSEDPEDLDDSDDSRRVELRALVPCLLAQLRACKSTHRLTRTNSLGRTRARTSTQYSIPFWEDARVRGGRARAPPARSRRRGQRLGLLRYRSTQASRENGRQLDPRLSSLGWASAEQALSGSASIAALR